MAIWKSLGTGGQVAVGAATAAVVAVIGWLVVQDPKIVPAGDQAADGKMLAEPAETGDGAAAGPETVVTTPAPVEVAAEPAVDAVAEPIAETVAEPAPPAVAEAPAAAAEVAAEAVAATDQPAGATEPPPAPTVDVVRVDPKGNALIAGSAEPDSDVSIQVDQAEVAVAKADRKGKFVAMFTLAPSDIPRVMTMTMRLADGKQIRATGDVILAPTLGPVIAPAAVASADPAVELAEVAAAEPAAEPAADLETAAADTLPAVVAAAEPEAPAVLLAEPTGIKVLQPAGDALAENVVIDTITYDQAGAVQLAGRGRADSGLQVYLDNAPIVTTRIEQDGNWRTPLPGVIGGLYTLRVDQLDAQGKVTSRYETPFKREEPLAIAALSEPPAPVAEPVAEAQVEPATPPETTASIAAEPMSADPNATLKAEAVAELAAEAPVKEVPVEEALPVEPAASEAVAEADAVAATEPAKQAETEPEVAPALEAAPEIVAEAEPAKTRNASPGATPKAEPAVAADEPAASAEVVVAEPAPAPAPALAPAPAPPAPEPEVAEAVVVPVEPVAEPVATKGAEALAEAAAEPVAEPVAVAEAVPEAAPETAPEAAPEMAPPAELALSEPQPAPTPEVLAPEPPKAADNLVVAAAETATEPVAQPVTELSPAAVVEGPRVTIITVQPGYTLWQIASEAYGEGVMYVQVWDANREKIRDPDLIYPGQVFTVPAPPD